MATQVTSLTQENGRTEISIISIGPSALFEDLYTRHYVDVFRYSLVLTSSRDEADDVAAETFLRAWREWSKGHEPDGPPLAWLLVIARNIATDRWRRASRVVTRLLPSRTTDGYAEVEAILWVESLARILPARQREVIALRYHRDLSDGEIGRLMGLSDSGVRSLAARAIAKLREHPEVMR
jgi:RNA polymerase sigma factor (sigma-70 family)